jgi:hypothetical protein
MAKQKKSDDADSRRTFLRNLAAAPMTPVVLGAAALPETVEAQNAPASDVAHVNAMAELVRLQFGQYLAAGDMEQIKRGLERNLRYSQALSKVKLINADEPDFIFFPDVP